MEEKALAYFSGINPLANKILEDCKKVELECESEWENWDLAKREEMLDDFLVHSFVKDRYRDQDSSEKDVSFPKLVLPCGEKIIVDFDNDCWTWQDEHSGPFSWKTKSQQDLSLKDLEANELTKVKSSSKTPLAGTAKNGGYKMRDGPGKPAVSKRIWDSPFHVGERKGDSGYPSSQDSMQSSFDDVRQSLELESREDCTFPVSNNGRDADRTQTSASKPAVLHISQKASSSSLTTRSPLKSPIIARLPLSPSINKKVNDGQDDTGMTLLGDNKRESVGQDNAAFVNLLEGESFEDLPVTDTDTTVDRGLTVNREWSSFVGESSSDTLSTEISSPSRRPLISSQDGTDQSVREAQGTTNQAAELVPSHSLLSPDDEDKESGGVVKTGFDFLDNW